jgi:hypothetical protein
VPPHHLLVLICRVGRVTESGGEIGRLNVVGGAEVCSLSIVDAQVFQHLVLYLGILVRWVSLDLCWMVASCSSCNE